jgi:crotonobetaine/carnitine-CoA ligase
MMDKTMLKVPSREGSVISCLLDRRAAEAPDQVFAIFQQNGEEWTHAETRERVRRYAAGLQQLGVRQGDLVLSWLPNGPHALLVWLGLNYLGAVYVPINTAYRGGVLEHVVRNSGARLIIADDRLAPRLAEIDRSQLETLVAIGRDAPVIEGLAVLPETALTGAGTEPAPPPRPIEPWDPQSVIYTSGTTGPSKGAVSSYIHYWYSVQSITLEPGERSMLVGPLFHMSGAGTVYLSLFYGCSFVMLEAFNTKSFWKDVRTYGITNATLLGAMTTFLLKEPPSPADRDHKLKRVLMVPLSDESLAFTERFGADIITVYNMTEINTPLVSEPNPTARGTSGKARPEVQLRIVDANDIEVPHGTVGEVVMRSDLPWTVTSGYHNNPEATARAWRNGWFHTGDAMYRDEQGNFFFVDRIKDAIRRRGENISSFEVEKELLAHPAIRDAAVIPVPSEFSEDEVLAAFTLVEGAAIDLPELVAFLTGRLAHFMVPRYYRRLDRLPTTPTNKVEKYILRNEGVTPDTWDREAAGIVIKREKLETRSDA